MWHIYLKEIRELIRDKKTLIFTILIPVFAIPLFFVGFAAVAGMMTKSAMDRDIKYAIFGARNSPELLSYLARQKQLVEVKLSNQDAIRSAIADEKIKFALVVPPGFDAAAAEGRRTTLELHFNKASVGIATRQRIKSIIDGYADKMRENALLSLKMDRTALDFMITPVELKETSTADERERVGAIVGGVLPYFLLIVCLIAAMYPAIDLGAGEKERGTLETLLLAPIPLHQMVLAKFLVLFSIGMTSALLMVISLGVLLGVFGAALDPDIAMLTSELGTSDFLMIALMLIPTAAMFAATLLSMSIYGRNYKEASGMMQPLAMLVLLPVMLSLVPGVELNWFWASIPLTNVSLAMKEIIKGTLDFRLLFMILATSTLIAGALLGFCRWWFAREEVLFRD